MKTIRVLHILDEISHNSGVSLTVGNWSRQKDPNVRFDYLVFSQAASDIIQSLKPYESEVFIIPKFSLTNFRKYRKQYEQLLHKKQYDIVHLHTPVTALMHLRAAKKSGVSIRVMHSHNTKLADAFLNRIRNRLLIIPGRWYASHYAACSTPAGKAVFGPNKYKKMVLLYNSVDTTRFALNIERREDLRRKFNLAGDVVILHVGRMCRQKNHAFLLDIFAKLVEQTDQAKLVLLGGGPLEQKLHVQSERLGISGKVIFAGVVAHPEDFMSAADILVMPSLYEGLPLVALEAQASGLLCFLSDRITHDAGATDRCVFLPIGDAAVWAECIQPHLHEKRQGCKDADALGKMNYMQQNVRLIEFYKSIIDAVEKQGS